ncbi:MAG: hypothetical protein AB1641_28415 [Thermodesulfobacteriota bacterium]
MAGDTDLWYHLDAGRNLVENHELLQDTSFSFLTPNRTWLNYWPLFQAVITVIHRHLGYFGLILFRGAVFLAALWLLYGLISRKIEKSVQWALAVWVMYLIALSFRFVWLVRPHSISYLFIIVFLYLLECRRDRLWLLPILTVIWINCHGIEYPVILVLLFAYLAELVWRGLRQDKTYQRIYQRERSILILSMFCLFLNPNGLKIMETPFEGAILTSIYITESKPLDLLSLSLKSLNLTWILTNMNVIIFLAVIPVLLLSLWKRKVELSHLLLFSGGVAIFILAKSQIRLLYEVVLLSLPLLVHGLNELSREERNNGFMKAGLIGLILIGLVALHLDHYYGLRPKYPFSTQKLPAGSVTMLNKLGLTGNVLHNQLHGGYLQWALSKSYKIFATFQLNAFNDLDTLQALNMFNDINVFKYLKKEYDPSFLIVPERAGLSEFEGYEPIFFDDYSILYASTSKYPDLVKEYGIKSMELSKMNEIEYEKLAADEKQRIIAELKKIHDVSGACAKVNMVLANIHISNKEYGPARTYAEKIIEEWPELYLGYSIMAQVLIEEGRYKEAVEYGLASLKKELGLKPDFIYRNLYLAYLRDNKFDKAFRMVLGFANPFYVNAPAKDVYEAALAAAMNGRKDIARIFLSFAEMKVQETDQELINKMNDLKARLIN